MTLDAFTSFTEFKNLKVVFFQFPVVLYLNLLESFDFKLFVSSGGSISLRGCSDGCIFLSFDR